MIVVKGSKKKKRRLWKPEEKRRLIFMSVGAMAIDGEYHPAELYGVYEAEDVDLEPFAIFTTLVLNKPIKLLLKLLSWSS